ncbi:MAG TPA: serine/threonine-protein kinase [Polyangiaceae bacterium]|nr:serine/threonine-protein kinase [Polyangiaceae bacterium]
MVRAGDSFDRYVIEELLGAGGMGQVFRAWDPRLQRSVALKIVRPEEALGGSSGGSGRGLDASERLLREARAAAALDHPNAVSVFDVGEVDGQTYIAMELVDGKTLSAYVGDAGLSLETRLRWLTDVARALAAAHRRGLVHRDIKPGNVMVREDGVVKVLDFGIARRVRAGEVEAASKRIDALRISPAASTQTADGVVLGTPLYMAPEQMRGESIDARADQFSWGVLAYELLAGRNPWLDEPHVAIAILTTDPKPLKTLVPELPVVVTETVTKALSKRAADRFDSMDDVVAALDSVLGKALSRPPVRVSGGPTSALGGATTRLTPAQGAEAAVPSRTGTGRKTSLAGVLAIGIACVAAAGLAISARTWTRAAATAASASASASAASSAPTVVTELPSPTSGSPEAIAAYRRGLEAQRAGSLLTERRELGAATAADPEMAQAWLRLAIAEIWTRDPTDAREHYRHAVDLLARLDAHDRALLDAAEPVIQRVPMDFAEHARRLGEAVARFPHDAELAGAQAYAVYRMGRWKEAIDAYEHAIALDPSQAEQFRFEGLSRAYLGDFDGARATADACDKACPTSGMCPMLRLALSEQAGDCAAEEANARSIMLKSTDEGYDWFGDALASEDKPVEAVREALRLHVQHMPKDAVAFRTAGDAVQLALWQGDFTTAERLTADVEKLASEVPTEEEHAYAAGPLVLAYLESGRTADARRAAEAFLARRASWTVASANTLSGLQRTVVPLMFEARIVGGAPAAEVKAQRDGFLHDWAAHLPEAHAHLAWVATYAYVATPEEAREAMASLPEYSPLPVFRSATLWTAAEGHVRLLAGDVAGALPLLEHGAGVCLALTHPVERVRAQLDLGAAREASGDRDGACKAYASVVARYGAAKPRSVTAEQAKARAAHLGCSATQ